MKNQLKLIFIFLLSFSIEKITINKAINYGCNLLGINQLYIEAISDEDINDMSFQFDVKEKEKKYNVKCSLLGDEIQKPNQTEPESDAFDPFNSNIDEEEIPPDGSDLAVRFLEETYKILGSCQIENVDKNETFLVKSFTNIVPTDKIVFKDNFNFSVFDCNNKKADNIESKLVISFRQLNDYELKKNENKIIFLFYGMVSNDLPKGYPIKMNVSLIRDNIEERKERTAICLLKKGIVIKGDEPVQGDFSCTIEDLKDEEIKNVNSFVLKRSNYFSGIPEDKVLLNPILTKKYIGLGKLFDCSIEDKNKEIIPSFNSTLIDDSNCGKNGIFIINGILTSNLNEDLKFDLPIAYPRNLTASCSIKSGNKNDSVNITCKTNGGIKDENIMIAQNTILDDNKKELLIISKIEAKDKSNCNNSKIQEINEKLENSKVKISFRQVNQFNSMNKNTTFLFIGISDQFLSSEKTLKILVFIILNGKKFEKEATCKLNSFSPLNSLNPNYGQAIFICEVNHNEYDKVDDLEIISSKDILGLNDDLEEDQKSPCKTDEKIKTTKNESSLGKVLNFSSTNDFYDIPPTFEISSINFDKCDEKGKIKVRGKFNQKIQQKFDFTIPFSYPLSSIKCTAPSIDANRNIDIDCKIQKDFYNVEQFIIEPRIIKKKNKEVIFIKDYTYNSNKQTCYNYNEIQKRIEEKKNEKNYSFLQTNNFTPLPSGFLFFIILIYKTQGNFPASIPVTIYTRKKISNLRNLVESQDEEDIICVRGDSDESSSIKGYNCTSKKIQANSSSDFEDFSIESSDVPGLYEDNSNPILTDNYIKSGVVPLITKDYKIDSFDNLELTEKNCNETGIFYINGDLSNKGLAQLKNFEIHYSNPPDSYGVCNFTSYNKMECHNAEAFEEEYLIINKQSLADGAVYFPGITSEDSFTCAISSLSSKLETPLGKSEIENSYFSKKTSSGGLNGGAIASIVIISAVVLIGIGVLIALIKNGVIFSPKQEISETNIPPISNSSANII
jgi:hypothetical protein